MRFRISGRWAAAVAIAMVVTMSAAQVSAVPVTSGLITQLDGSNLSAGAVSVWGDQATDSSPGTQQDFGQATADNQPTAVANFVMPNEMSHTIVDFVRGAVSSSNNSNATSDYLRGRTGGDSMNDFGGADPAYSVSSGLSWFVVFRSNITSTSTSGNNERQQRQGVLYSSYDSAIDFGTRYINDTGGGTINEVPDLFSAARDGVGGSLEHPAGDVTSPTASWYISGGVWDLDTGGGSSSLLSRIIQEDQTILTSTLTGAVWTTGLPDHLAMFLGAISVPGNGSWALDGQIAEVLIYDSALSNGDFDSVMNYLNNKYLVPEPGSIMLILLGFTGLIAGWCRQRWKAA